MSKQQKAKAVNTAAPKPAETQAPTQDNQTPAPTENTGEAVAEQPTTGASEAAGKSIDGATQEGGDQGGASEPEANGTPSEGSEPEAQEPAPTQAPAPVAVEPVQPELSHADEALARAAASGNNTLKVLAQVLTDYRAAMGETKATDAAVIEEQNAQLWAALRMATRSGDAFRDCVQLVLAVFRENADGAFKLNMLLRGIDRAGGRLNADHRAGYTGLVTLLQAAAGLNNPKEVSRYINMGKAMESVVFADDARQRVIGYFS